MKKRQASLWNLHIVSESYMYDHILSFWLLPKFTDKLPVISTCMIFHYKKIREKIETDFKTLFSFIEKCLLCSVWVWTTWWGKKVFCESLLALAVFKHFLQASKTFGSSTSSLKLCSIQAATPVVEILKRHMNKLLCHATKWCNCFLSLWNQL